MFSPLRFLQENHIEIVLLGMLQLGNPETSEAEDWKGLVDYAWSHAVISDETHTTIKESCDFESNNTWSNNECSDAVGEVLKQYKEIDMYSLYTSVCIAHTTSSNYYTMQVVMKRSSNMVSKYSKFTVLKISFYLKKLKYSKFDHFISLFIS